ncbi:DUF1659 domain-containing protein [Alteribacter populi]|uniref:DUF1659 domain-containing protein n=1 Tax=Alteribacter populi TaxID=2011011 RepID=UPI0012FD639F|nr:DUF1659 domain-containing protein [Alteribacter populi]
METTINSRLAMTFVVGYNDDGDEIERTKQFQNIDPAAGNSELAATAAALAPLQMHSLVKVERNNTYDLQGE